MLNSAAKTDLGHARRNNEDCYLVCPDLSLWIMADGVGGHDAGEVASQIACDTIKSEVEKEQELVTAINTAHQSIKHSFEHEGVGRPGMASTVVAMLLRNNQYQIAWVGDSRAYLWRDGKLTQLTHDQSLVQRMIDEKIITPQQARTHPKRNLVTQALGQQSVRELDVEVIEGELKSGDKILLCSDGLTDYVTDEEIAQLFDNNSDHQILVDELVSAALAASGKDNITVVAVNNEEADNDNVIPLHSGEHQRDMAARKKAILIWLPVLVVGLLVGLSVVGSGG